MLAAASFALSLLVLIGSALLVPLVVARMPADYFVREQAPEPQHPLISTLKTLLGVLLVLAGVAMLVLPGQGVLTILAGLSLLRFRAKRDVERWILRRAPVARVVDALRRRAGRPPLVLDVE